VRRILLALVVLALVPSACRPDGGGGASADPRAGGYVECVVPRPEVCTKEYRPVCGLRDTGVRCVTAPCDEAWEERTYSNACTACSHDDVYGWRPGACQAEGPADG
jgi:hypothetical protein